MSGLKNIILFLIALVLFQKVSFSHEIGLETFDLELLDKVAKECNVELKAFEAATDPKEEKIAREKFDSCLTKTMEHHHK